MARYLFTGGYSQAGIKGVLAEGGSGRRAAVAALAESVGGSLESFDFAFGKDDYHIVCELPSNEAAAAIAMTVASSGSASVRTTVLLTVEQVDEARRLSPVYRAPGT